MILLLLLLVFIFGTTLGSFLGVLVDRLPRGGEVLRGRSKCEHCHKILGVRDLIPVLSYILLKGRCRACHSKIPIHVFLVEFIGGITTSLLFLYSYYSGLNVFEFIVLFVILASFIGIFFADLTYGIIPDEFIATIIISSLLLLISHPSNIFSNLIANVAMGLLVFSFFLVIFLVTRARGMGFGDVKLAFAIGLLLGFPRAIVALYLAFLTGALISIILVLLGKKRLRGDSIAFGPYLVIGATVAYFFGSQILSIIF